MTRSEIMSRIKSKNTKPEILVRSFLHREGFRFSLHRKDLPGKPDIVLPRYRTCIFVNGCFWHAHDCEKFRMPKSNQDFWKDKFDTNKKRDKRKCRQLRRLGWSVLTIWECEVVKSKRLETLARRIKRNKKNEHTSSKPCPWDRGITAHREVYTGPASELRRRKGELLSVLHAHS